MMHAWTSNTYDAAGVADAMKILLGKFHTSDCSFSIRLGWIA